MTSNGPHFGEAAQTALRNAASPAQGAKVYGPAAVLTELRDAGMICKRNGLTRAGSIARERLVSAQLEAAFG